MDILVATAVGWLLGVTELPASYLQFFVLLAEHLQSITAAVHEAVE
jgi:hypothetical protein